MGQRSGAPASRARFLSLPLMASLSTVGLGLPAAPAAPGCALLPALPGLLAAGEGACLLPKNLPRVPCFMLPALAAVSAGERA